MLCSGIPRSHSSWFCGTWISFELLPDDLFMLLLSSLQGIISQWTQALICKKLSGLPEVFIYFWLTVLEKNFWPSQSTTGSDYPLSCSAGVQPVIVLLHIRFARPRMKLMWRASKLVDAIPKKCLLVVSSLKDLCEEPHFQRTGWCPSESPAGVPCRQSLTRSSRRDLSESWWKLHSAATFSLPCSSICWRDRWEYNKELGFDNKKPPKIHKFGFWNFELFTCEKQIYLAKTNPVCCKH